MGGKNAATACRSGRYNLRRSAFTTTSSLQLSPADMTGWTVDKVLEASSNQLVNENVPEPHESVQHLLADALSLPWETGFRDVRYQNDRTLTSEEAQEFAAKLTRRQRHEPIQYILGKWDFLDYTVTIKPPLLCPRPETEELVVKVVEETTESPIHILDVGCGTGVIGIALAEMLPDATVEAIDIDPVAVEVSKENAAKVLGETFQRDCYNVQLVSAEDYSPDHHFDIVVSNPPYIPLTDRASISTDVVDFENERALFAGEDGMDVIRIIIRQLSSWCNSGAVCWMEVDPTHPQMIEEWVNSTPELQVNFESAHKDLFGKDRFVKLSVK
ncbi:MAG: hypothetical protein SGARI_006102 [Bacillariaceae sp.]